MNALSIILIIAAALIGSLITFFVAKGKLSNTEETIQQNKLIETQQAQIAEVQKNASEMAEQKEKAEKLLDKTKKELDELDEQFKALMSSGKVDPSMAQKFADTDKLKKRIKDLEDQLEDAEDDLNDTEKKLKNKAAELSDANQKYEQLETAYQKTVKEVGDIRYELNQKKEELTLKMGSLEFVQNILTAQTTETQDIATLNKNIDIFESFVKGQYTDLLSYLFKANFITWNDKGGQEGLDDQRAVFHSAFDQWSATKRKSWLDGKTSIAFIGEFSAGKTSIVNRILSQDNPNVPLLPVSTKATTAIPTYIAGGSKSSYTFISDNKRKTISESTFKSVSKEILGQVKGVSSLIKYFVMTYQNANLNGLSILDTPGFNSNDADDANRTIEVINECDALFWVFDVNAGTINKTSINQIKNKLEKPLFVIINKVDTKSKSDVDKVEQLIKNTLQREGINVEAYIRFSKSAPLADIMTPIKSVTRDESRDTFVQALRTNIEQIIKILENGYKEYNQNVNAQDQYCDQLTDQIINCLNAMGDECVEASNIPHWETHIFSSDRYEMSGFEGNRLMELLQSIAETRINELSGLVDQRIDAAHNAQQAYSYLCDIKAALQKANECFNEFKKVSKHFN